MAGQTIAPASPPSILIGWAVQVLPPMPQRWDHTYVTSSCGSVWGCWGQHAGGAQVCAGPGDVAIAHCLAGHNGLAGIRYGFTGVCHQISNRILHPTGGLTVSGARGYRSSLGVWGVYGLGRWQELTICYVPPGTMQVSTHPRPNVPPAGTFASDTTLSSRDASEGLPMSSEHEEDRSNALRTIIREYAPHLAFTDKERSCVDIHIAFWLFQSELMQQFDAGRLTKGRYLELFNERARFMVEQDIKLLGERDFCSIFGEEGAAIENLINPDIFFSDGPTQSQFMRYG